MSDATTRAYRDGQIVSQGFDLAAVSDYLEDPSAIVWIDVCGPTATQLRDLAQEFGLHQLAVEDTLGRYQRPKLDRYASHLFLACNTVQADVKNAKLNVKEIDAFIGDRWLVTVRPDDEFSMAPVVQRWDLSPDLATHGVSFMLYALLDVVVDTYFDAIDAFDQYCDHVSNQIFSDKPLDPTQQRHWFEMRRSMVRLHRTVVPMRDSINSLLRRGSHAVPDELYPYFEDVYDHVLRVNEASDSLRELVGTIMEANLTLRDYRQNQIMKKVSSWAAIIAVPTLITGFYGMNVPYPGFGDPWGVVAAAGLIVVTCAGLYRLFRRVDWL